MHFRSRKKTSQTINVPKSAIKLNLKNKRLSIYKTYLGNIRIKKQRIPEITQDCTLSKIYGKFYLNIPYQSHIINNKPMYNACALDPGARTMHVLYSPEEVIKFQQNNKLTKRTAF